MVVQILTRYFRPSPKWRRSWVTGSTPTTTTTAATATKPWTRKPPQMKTTSAEDHLFAFLEIIRCWFCWATFLSANILKKIEFDGYFDLGFSCAASLLLLVWGCYSYSRDTEIAQSLCDGLRSSDNDGLSHFHLFSSIMGRKMFSDMLMGIESWTSGVGSKLSTNCAPTFTHYVSCPLDI